MAPRVTIEGQWGECGVAGIDAHGLDTGEQQQRPDQVEADSRGHEQAQGNPRGDAFGAECHSEMSDEHG
ncbi:MAG: hypothetical protein M3Q55_10340 [Acidobacteriota bacterium]|nr:hypothetical protein [Acidobacteriota bacterium]